MLSFRDLFRVVDRCSTLCLSSPKTPTPGFSRSLGLGLGLYKVPEINTLANLRKGEQTDESLLGLRCHLCSPRLR